MKHLVTGCIDCPMYELHHDDRWGEESNCNHPLHKKTTVEDVLLVNDHPVTPTWCPLKSEPITIQMSLSSKAVEILPDINKNIIQNLVELERVRDAKFIETYFNQNTEILENMVQNKSVINNETTN